MKTISEIIELLDSSLDGAYWNIGGLRDTILKIEAESKVEFKREIIDAYNEGWRDSENKGLDNYSAEKYYIDKFE